MLQELWHSQWDQQSNRTVAVHQAGTIKNELPEDSGKNIAVEYSVREVLPMCGLWKAGGPEAIIRGIKTGLTIYHGYRKWEQLNSRDVPGTDEFWKPLSQKRLQGGSCCRQTVKLP